MALNTEYLSINLDLLKLLVILKTKPRVEHTHKIDGDERELLQIVPRCRHES